ncbi:MAG: hypothetical protein DWQ10_05590 [Calditrichaeota bacterium]|nr:MAG: hypothetical protein DWQ10_05590 [Calditrichota bacterium]
MKTKILFYCLFLILIPAQSIFAQNSLVGFGGGYAYLDNETYFTQDPNGGFRSPLGLRNSYSINTRIKYIKPKLPFKIRMGLDFISANNNTSFMGVRSWVDSHFTNMHIDANQNIYSASFGIESPVIKSIVTPYFSLGILANFFQETKVKIKPEPEEYYPSDDLNFDNNLRFGISTGIGFEYQLLKAFLVDISIDYKFMNLMGKSNNLSYLKEENFNTLSIVCVAYYDL